MIPLNLKQWEVLAILAGRLTQIRRVVKHINPAYLNLHCSVGAIDWRANREAVANGVLDHPCRSPFGSPGDAIYGRETWAVFVGGDPRVEYRAGGVAFEGDKRCYATKARMSLKEAGEHYDGTPSKIRWQPSTTMPEWMSRIHLITKAVRVQRVQEISPDDVFACGVDLHMPEVCIEFGVEAEAKACYSQRWDSDNGEGSWNANPWVFCGTFEINTVSP